MFATRECFHDLDAICLDLRLQLLEPDKYPALHKCMYGLLMLLPQSSAFATLRNRLGSVVNLGLLQLLGDKKTAYVKFTTDIVINLYRNHNGVENRRWSEAVEHFKTIQAKQQANAK
jgi:vacuole morphology and inheritance protein 14